MRKIYRNYQYIIFDVDDTLLDYKQAETNTLSNILNKIPISPQIAEKCWELSTLCWNQYGLNRTQDQHIQTQYHTLYFQYLKTYMEALRQEFGLTESSEVLIYKFIECMKSETHLLPHAEMTCRILSEHATLAIATNGLCTIQRSRIRPLEKYFTYCFISEEIGVIKPHSIFFDTILSTLKTDGKNCLMVGDSLTSDIAGAKKAGMDTCWLNKDYKTSSTNNAPTYEIHQLRDLL